MNMDNNFLDLISFLDIDKINKLFCISFTNNYEIASKMQNDTIFSSTIYDELYKLILRNDIPKNVLEACDSETIKFIVTHNTSIDLIINKHEEKKLKYNFNWVDKRHPLILNTNLVLSDNVISLLNKIVGVTKLTMIDRYTIGIDVGEMFNWTTIMSDMELLLNKIYGY